MKKSLLAAAAVAMMSTSASAMYIVGDIVEGGWSPANGIEMTAVEGGWEWTGNMAAGQYFAFATQLEPSGDWDTFNSTYRLGPDANNTVAGEGEFALSFKETSFKGAGADCTYFVKEENGAYTLKVTLNSAPIEPSDVTYYLRGGMNNWEAPEEYAFTETATKGVYTLAVAELGSGVAFKVASNDWGYEYSSGNASMVMDTEYEVYTNGASNMAMAEACTDVVLTLDTNKNTFKVTKDDGSKVNAVEAAGSESVYYNLQGVKIAQPEKGIVIRVANGKSEKVVL